MDSSSLHFLSEEGARRLPQNTGDEGIGERIESKGGGSCYILPKNDEITSKKRVGQTVNSTIVTAR